jgi:IS30 family transposase
MPYDALSLLERVQIEVGLARDESATTIARSLGRVISTVTRELDRNGGADAYSAAAAQARAHVQRRRPRPTRLQSDRVLACHVEQRLRRRDSPMTIAIELARGLFPDVTATVSHETIYAAVYAHGRAGLATGLHTCLHRRRRRRKNRRDPAQSTVTSPLGTFAKIAERPAEADGRDVVGHLEGDLITGSFNRSAIVTVFDRASRHMWLADLPEGHGAEATLAALIELLERIPPTLRRTLTWDRGVEMAQHDLLADAVDIDIYFAEAHSPWQRPTNENGNGLLRRYVGKGTNLALHTASDLRRIEDRINTMPRRSLGWQTATCVYHDAVALTA